MFYVLASVVCSVLVSVLLKLAPRWRVDVQQAVAWNYVVAGVATAVLLQPSLAPLAQAPWLTLILLGILLPTLFLVLAASVRHAGIVRSDVAQRLSLVLPLLAAFLLFGETPTTTKIVGCALGLAALFGMVWRADAGARGDWKWPLLVFAGFGVIDILFKRVAAAGLPLGTSLQVVFALAMLVAFCIAMPRRVRFDLRGFIGGIALGLLNFGNILFYLRAHRALPHEPSLVFASMNLGVVALGTVVGVVAFRERLGRLNIAALGLAVIAVLVLMRV